MFRATSALSLLLAGTVSAQQPSIEVLDLLLPEAANARLGEPNIVTRTYSERWPSEHHVVAGEGHLLTKPLPFFDERTLTTALELLPVSFQQPIDFVRLGERVQLHTPAPEQLQAALATVRSGLPARISCIYKLERTNNGKTTTLLTSTESFANGETLTIGDVQRETLVADLEVEIAQASATGNPVTREVTRGASAALRVRQLPGTDVAIVEVVSRVAAPFAAEPIPGGKVTGSFDRIATQFEESGLVFRATRGEPTQHEWTAGDGSLMRLSCNVDWARSPAGGAVLSTPLLHAPIVGFRSGPFEPDDLREMIPVGDLVADSLQGGDDGREGDVELISRKTKSPVIVMKNKDGEAEVARVFQSLDALLQPTSVVLEAFDVPAGTEVGATGAAPAGAKKLLQLRGAGIVGLPSCFASGRERSVVHDWDVEVAQGARISDPKVKMFEDGWFATIKVMPAMGKQRRVEVALDIDHLVELRKLVVPISASMVAATESSTTIMPAETVPVEQAVIRSVQIGKTMSLDEAGNALLRQAAPNLLGAGRELVVRLRVK